jgi:hypothetical protein
MDSLFADLGVVHTIKSGVLKKAGGRSKEKWQSREFTLTSTGLSWPGTSLR